MDDRTHQVIGLLFTTPDSLERMAHAAVVRSDEAQRGEDTGTKYPIEEQRSMTEGGHVYPARLLAVVAAGARFFEVSLSLYARFPRWSSILPE
jgi:hypothetical protein